MRVLHVLYQSLPTVVGSSIRSHSLLKALAKKSAASICVVTSPFQNPLSPRAQVDLIDGVTYQRTYCGDDRLKYSENPKGMWLKLKKLLALPGFAKQLVSVVREQEIDVIHAHSTFFVGLASYVAARICGVPMVYEVRSLWEERLRKHSSLNARISYVVIRALESASMRLAGHVVCINDGLKTDLMRRGIPESRISVVYNAVDLSMVGPRSPIRDRVNFGYIGLLSRIENVDRLIVTFDKLSRNYGSIELHIFGDGNDREALDRLCLELGNERIVLHGAVDYFAIGQAYDCIDVIVLTRERSHLTESVTPLKPLEAMAYRKIVLGNDLRAFREIIVDGETGFIFDDRSLYQVMERVLLEYPTGSLDRVLDAAENWVKEKKSWDIESEKYIELYRDLVESFVR